jgi:hypothetical protein
LGLGIAQKFALLAVDWNIVYVDAEAVEGALIKGYSSRSDICQLVSVFWDLALELKCLVYIDRVPTDANVADGPSRFNFRDAVEAGWVRVPVAWPPSVLPE